MIEGRVFIVDDQGVSHVPSLIEMQLESYKWFLTEGLKELLQEITPIGVLAGHRSLSGEPDIERMRSEMVGTSAYPTTIRSLQAVAPAWTETRR